MLKTTKPHKRRFEIVLIKPSHYDDKGYVIQWLRSTMPSNSLAVVNALARSAARRELLGSETDISVTAIDETNTPVRLGKLIERFQRNDCFGFVGFVGVQSNEYPRALDLARPIREAGVNVVIGGFHVSGCLAMLPEVPHSLRNATELGISLFAGECEEHLDDLIRDAAAGALKPTYNFMKDLPAIDAIAAPPFLEKKFITQTVGNVTSFDAGRGCPFQCSFCTIINVQGRKSRYRSPDSVEHIIRSNWRQGVNRFFITDDNFARNKDWESIYDRIIELREEQNLDVRFMIQVDTQCHKIPRFIEKSKRAGVTRVFIGLENINPDNLIAAKKRQNKLTEYRKMLLAWKDVGIMTFGGYILGFPNDTPETIRRDIEIIKDELPIDALEFFILTPLPGSEDHRVLSDNGVNMDEDVNFYELEHVVTDHTRMPRDVWQKAYVDAWADFYTPTHMEKILRRAAASGIDIWRLMVVLLWFSAAHPIEKVHPLQAGIFRRRIRTDRRPGWSIEPIWQFYPKLAFEIFKKHAQLAQRWWALYAICKRISRDDMAKQYMDRALTPISDENDDDLSLYTQTAAARVAVSRERRVAGVSQ